MIVLFSGQAADGQSSVVDWAGGVGEFVAYGDFGGGTAKLQMSPDGGTTWIDVSGASLTADGHKAFGPLGAGLQLRADLSSSTSPDLNARIF